MSPSIAAIAATTALATASCAPGHAQPGESITTLQTSAGPVVVEAVASGLEHPWGLAFLPDGRMLITERPGRLRIITADGALSDPLDNVPAVAARGQGGLLDVALDPDFEGNQLVYLTYSKPGRGGTATTALGRARLTDTALEDFEDIFVQEPYIRSDLHFGSRIAFHPDGTLFLALSERFQFDPAQDLSNTLGKVVRINRDGSIPDDNPFVTQDGADPAIWSYGHRNIQAAALHPDTNELWVVEFGPQGGDELNRPEAGHNYGWPLVSWGNHYNGRDIPDPPTRPDLDDAVKHWNPVFSPSGMIFYTCDVFEEWRGSALVGGLSGQTVVRLEIEDGQVTHEERLPMGARIREVAQGPDGLIYLLTDHDDGQVWRLRPE